MESMALRYVWRNYPKTFVEYEFECVDEILYPPRPDSICVLESPHTLLSLIVFCERGGSDFVCSICGGDKRRILPPKARRGKNSDAWFGTPSLYYLLFGPYDMDYPFSMSPEDLEKRALVYKTREKYVMDHLQELMDLFSESSIEKTIGTLEKARQLLREAQDRRIEEIQAKRKKEKE